jgi:two-component system alkaline phosphatase synthesis response regulator PhoP
MITNKNSGKKILVIDDEKHIAEAIKLNLKMQGHEVVIGVNGLEGLNWWKEFVPDLVIVDLMMPEIDGIGVISEIRKRDDKLPIMVISAKDQVKEKIKCLSMGVDDYLSKPFDLDEFLLRVDRLLTRSKWSQPTDTTAREKSVTELSHFSFGSNTIDFKNLMASSINGKFELTLQESKILKVFIENPNMPLTREEILEKALGYDRGVTTRTLDNFLVRFRKYFEEDPKNPKYFKSVRSVGYLFDPET